MKKDHIVIFDVFKTLINLETDEKQQSTYDFLSQWLSYKGILIDSRILRNDYITFCKKEFKCNPEKYPDIDVGQVFKQIIDKHIHISQSEYLVEDTALIFRILTIKSLFIYNETKDILNLLYGKVRMAIASNAQRLFTIPELKKFNLLRYFEKILFSSDIKIGKPNSIFFHKILEMTNVEPKNAIYVGDNLFDDIWGAQQAGIKTIWINRNEKIEFPSKIKRPVPDIEVSSDSIINIPQHIFSLI